MMPAIDPHPGGAEDLRQPARIADNHIVCGGHVIISPAVLIAARLLGQVLPQRAAERDIEHLRATAYREQRPAIPGRPSGYRDLGTIQFRLEFIVPGNQGRLAVELRTDIPAARQEYTITKVIEYPQLIGRTGRHRERHAAACRQPLQVCAFLHKPFWFSRALPRAKRYRYDRHSH